jgi:mRNA interferase RelE/StbE
VTYRITLARSALDGLGGIRDRRIREKIIERIDGLERDPEKQGKPLTAELAGYRSLRAAGQRYRIIYRVEKRTVTVYVVALGLRKEGDREDIYSLATKLIRLKLLEPPEA